jgi:hypothetical protein
MEPLDFLAAVLPSPGHGYYCAAELSSKRKQHVFTEDIAEIRPHVDRWLEGQQDIYFALATFADKGNRTADNAGYIKSIFIDMDGYDSRDAAQQALDRFLADTGLNAYGNPWIVASGGGLHCYWPFDKPLTVAEWKPIAEAFKRLCKERSLAIDNTVTADAARVLRVPGTKNFKKKYGEPRPVEVLSEGAKPINAQEFFAKLRELLGDKQAPAPSAPLLDLPGKRPITASKTGVQMLANSVVRFRQILQRTGDGDGCLQLQHYFNHASDDGMEPLWRGWLSQTKYCADGDKASIMLTQLHPYSEERMHEKLREIKGPYPCVKFDSENPGVCKDCTHFGKITNPLALGRELVSDNTEKEIEITPADPDDPGAPTVKVVRPTPPKGYAYGANGGVYADRIVEEADGNKRKQQVMILPYDMFVVDILQKDNEHTVHMVANRPGKPADVLFPQKSVVAKDELLKALANQNIMASFGAGTDKNLFDYVRACVEEASVNKQVVKIPAQYGWQEDNSFVYSGRVFYPDGAVRTVPMPDLQNLTRNTRAMGTLEEWRRFPQLMIKRKHYDLLAMSCIAFGSPLMKFTQFACLTFHAGSTQSGTGKSLALSLLNSVWGHPVRYRTGKSTSAVTMQQRMGNLNSLPFTSDEITHKSRHDMEWFPGLIFDLSEGQGKEKSEVHHNRERINLVSWNALSFLTSNTHMHDYMAGVREHTSQGELFRMLEWTPEEKLNWTIDEEEILRLLNTNHGAAGEKYVRWLVQNREVAVNVTRKTLERLKREWNMSGDERYWAAGCACVVAGAILASSRYADVMDYPVEEIIKSLKKLVDKARKVIKTGARSAEDVLNAFTRDNYGQFVVVKNSDGKLLAALGSGEVIDQTITRSKVMGRVEHEIDTPGMIDYFIEESVMRAHCVSMSFGYDDFKRQIAVSDGYVVRMLRKDMMSKTRGPQMRVHSMCISRKAELDPHAETIPVDGD